MKAVVVLLLTFLHCMLTYLLPSALPICCMPYLGASTTIFGLWWTGSGLLFPLKDIPCPVTIIWLLEQASQSFAASKASKQSIKHWPLLCARTSWKLQFSAEIAKIYCIWNHWSYLSFDLSVCCPPETAHLYYKRIPYENTSLQSLEYNEQYQHCFICSSRISPIY